MWEAAWKFFLLWEVIIPVVLVTVIGGFWLIGGGFSAIGGLRSNAAKRKWSELANAPEEDESEIL